MSSDLFKFNIGKPKTETTPATMPARQPLQTVPKALAMSDETFNNLRDLIYKISGIYYTTSKKYLLEGRIAKRVTARGFSSFEQYIEFLKSPSSKDELKPLYDAITINETYFFRAEQQFEAFEKIIVPEIMQLKQGISSPIFRIWSAASSTGEEAYTLALIILERLKPKFPNVTFQILASDINESVVEAARTGIYKDYAVRNIPPAYLNKYFTKQANSFVLSDQVKRMVKFMNINLYDNNQMRMITSCDVIFCCNVLIYFDIPSKQKVVSYLYNSLNKGGYLFIGYSESLHGISKAFKLVHLPKAMAYKKE
jgi:chemotaxis protein methyltransferase CheR